nr:hypothetical protein [uncultured Mediterranean phage uvMED]
MMITWKIYNVEYIEFVSDKTKVIKNIHWWAEQTDDNGNKGYSWGNQQLDIGDLANFTAWDQVTEQQCIDWVKTAMGETLVSQIESDIAQQLNNPDPLRKRAYGLPWSL